MGIPSNISHPIYSDIHIVKYARNIVQNIDICRIVVKQVQYNITRAKNTLHTRNIIAIVTFDARVIATISAFGIYNRSASCT